ncbi:MAG: hypothetical protein ABRQ37_25005 [Candidatus Eremiobacterota bacterium]
MKQKMTLNEIREHGLQVLVKELGPAGLIRFLQQYETGYGDYSIERHKLLGESTVDKLAGDIKNSKINSQLL